MLAAYFTPPEGSNEKTVIQEKDGIYMVEVSGYLYGFEKLLRYNPEFIRTERGFIANLDKAVVLQTKLHKLYLKNNLVVNVSEHVLPVLIQKILRSDEYGTVIQD